jgi:hypothetical protein
MIDNQTISPEDLNLVLLLMMLMRALTISSNISTPIISSKNKNQNGGYLKMVRQEIDLNPNLFKLIQRFKSYKQYHDR